MPRIREVELNLSSIETKLSQTKLFLLPEVFLREPLTEWILKFDRKLGERPTRSDSRYAPDPMRRMLIKEISERVVQPTLSFYHSTLMQLGPQWAIAEEGLEHTQNILKTDNLELSSKEIEIQLTKLDIEYDEVRGRVMHFAQQLANAWDTQIQFATRAWEVWRKEVNNLKIAMDEAERKLSDPHELASLDIFNVIEICIRPSELSYYGFPDNRELAFGKTLSLVALAGLFTLSRNRSLDPYRHRRDFEDFFISFSRAEKERSQIPIVVEEFRALEAEYAGNDPFEIYRSETKPADEALYRIAIHNVHRDGAPSRWLREYKKTLRTLSDWTPPKAFFENISEQKSLNYWGATTADAEIKMHVISANRAFHSDLTQFAFEQKWIQVLARHLFKEKTKTDSPNALLFYDFVRNIATILADRGNIVTAPSEKRLRILITKISKDPYFYEDW